MARFKMTFREEEEVDWLLLTRNINGFYNGNSIESSDDVYFYLKNIGCKLKNLKSLLNADIWC